MNLLFLAALVVALVIFFIVWRWMHQKKSREEWSEEEKKVTERALLSASIDDYADRCPNLMKLISDSNKNKSQIDWSKK